MLDLAPQYVDLIDMISHCVGDIGGTDRHPAPCGMEAVEEIGELAATHPRERLEAKHFLFYPRRLGRTYLAQRRRCTPAEVARTRKPQTEEVE